MKTYIILSLAQHIDLPSNPVKIVVHTANINNAQENIRT
jgi:hypothetical protein